MKRFLLAALAALMLATPLAGCASRAAETPAQRVFAIQTEYNGALAVALAYESQPRCSETQPQPCSDPAAVNEIRKADNDAWAALLAAQEYVRAGGHEGGALAAALAAARSALGVLTAVLANHGLL